MQYLAFLLMLLFYGTLVSLTIQICHSGLAILTLCVQSVVHLMSRLKVLIAVLIAVFNKFAC